VKPFYPSSETVLPFKRNVYRYVQCAAHERTITSQQSQLSKLADKCASLEGAVKKFEKDPETVLAELKNAAGAAERVAAAEEKVKEMEHRLSVVTRSKEAGLASTFHRVIIVRQNTVQLRPSLTFSHPACPLTASMVHVVTNLTPGSACNLTKRWS
jgi:hypothetical protein